MQAYTAEASEAQQDQQIDTLAQLREDMQGQMQQQLSNSRSSSTATDPSNAFPAAGAEVHAPSISSVVQAAVEAALAGAAVPEPAPAAEDAAALIAVGPARAASVASGGSGEDEWHLVSPGGSVKGGSSGRYSFDCAGGATPVLDAASTGSDTTSTPRDTLAESILGHPVLMAAAATDEGVALQQEHAGLELGHDDLDILRAASRLSSEGSLDGMQADTVEAAAADTAAAAAAAVDTDDSSSSEEVLSGLGLLSGEIVMGLAGIKQWIMESLAAIVEGGRSSQAACLNSALNIQRSLQLSAKQGNLLAAAAIGIADWRVALSSAAAVVCLAMYLKSRKENTALRSMLRRRDHELSKLVMRVVSLQELLNQGQTLPITRYMRYEGGVTHSVANYM